MRVANLDPIKRIRRLRELAIAWNPKLKDISPLGELRALTALRLDDTPRVFDLQPLAGLSSLVFLEFSGGIWNKNRVATLEPIGGLPQLQELVLTNLGVESGDLRPLGKCSNLLRLTVSNQFPTEDYAFLSVALANTECSMFAAYVKLQQPLAGKDVMVVGKGKPLLSTARDGPRLARYAAEFAARRDEHRQRLTGL